MNLIAADLRGADLYGANLDGANLRHAKLRGARGLAEEVIRAATREEGNARFELPPKPNDGNEMAT